MASDWLLSLVAPQAMNGTDEDGNDIDDDDDCHDWGKKDFFPRFGEIQPFSLVSNYSLFCIQ